HRVLRRSEFCHRHLLHRSYARPPLLPPPYAAIHFFLEDAPAPRPYTLSLHATLFRSRVPGVHGVAIGANHARGRPHPDRARRGLDRKSTRLNSSHVAISYAVFCLKKKARTPTLSQLAVNARRLDSTTV